MNKIPLIDSLGKAKDLSGGNMRFGWKTACCLSVLLLNPTRGDDLNEWARIRGRRRETWKAKHRFGGQLFVPMADSYFEEDSTYWGRLLDEVSFSIESSFSMMQSTNPRIPGESRPTPRPRAPIPSAVTKPPTSAPVESVFDPIVPPTTTSAPTFSVFDPIVPQPPSPQHSISNRPPQTPPPTIVAADVPSPPTAETVTELIMTVALNNGDEFDFESYYQFKALSWLVENKDITSYTDEQIIQRYVLACIYFATFAVPNGMTGDTVLGWTTDTHWMTDEHECIWFGLFCDADGFVFAMDMSSNYMTGVFPPEVILMNETLVDLRLKGNMLHNQGDMFNAFLGDLTRLEVLLIGETFFEYNGIPTEIGRLSNLREFECQSTLWYGPLRGEIFANMPFLYLMDLSFNKFDSPIPMEVGMLPSLEYLYIESSNVTGDLSYMLHLDNIVELWIGENQFLGGAIPTFVGNINTLVSFSIKGCGLTGTLPTELGDLSNMKRLIMDGNNLIGEVPSEIGKLERLEIFRIEENGLEGTMPDEVCELADDFSLVVLTADCTDYNEFECPCCTECYPCETCTGGAESRYGERLQRSHSTGQPAT